MLNSTTLADKRRPIDITAEHRGEKILLAAPRPYSCRSIFFLVYDVDLDDVEVDTNQSQIQDAHAVDLKRINMTDILKGRGQSSASSQTTHNVHNWI